MKNEKTTIKQALTILNISRTSLYNHMKKLGIKPIKERGRVHLVDSQINDLKAVLQTTCKPLDSKSEQRGQAGQGEQQNKTDELYEKQIQELKKELKKERAENKKLIQDVGRWQGRATTLEEQNIKLLSINAENENNIVEAEIITPEPAPEEKAEKKGFFQKFFSFK